MQKYAQLNRDVKIGPFIYQSRKNGSVIYSFLGKRGLIVYLAALEKGAIRAAHPYHVMSYIGSYPPPPIPPSQNPALDTKVGIISLKFPIDISHEDVTFNRGKSSNLKDEVNYLRRNKYLLHVHRVKTTPKHIHI